MLLEQEKIQEIEQKIGYEFDNKYLLTQAFIRTSYVNESKERVKSNEVLEFYGDRALEFVVTKLMAEKFGRVENVFWDGAPLKDPEEVSFGIYSSEYRENKLSQIKASLVEKKALASAMEKLDLQKYLYLGKGDIEREIEEEKSVKEDLFEAILGAVAIDCNWNTEVLTKVVLAMHNTEGRISNIFINAEIEQAFEESYTSIEYNVYIEETEEWLSRKLLWKGFKSDIEVNEWWNFQKSVTLTICDKKDKILACYRGYGETKQEAVSNAKENALNGRRSIKEINPILASTEKVSLENAINVIQELNQKGFLEKAIYIDNKTHIDKHGNPRWEVELIIPKIGRCMAVGYASKKEAKKAVAYRAICEIRDMLNGKIELFPDIYDASICVQKYGIIKPIAIIKDSVISNKHLGRKKYDSLICSLENGDTIKLDFIKETLKEQGFEILSENKDKLNNELKKYLSLVLRGNEEECKNRENDISTYYFCEQLLDVTIWDKEYGQGKIVGYDIVNGRPWEPEYDEISFKVKFNSEKTPKFIDYYFTIGRIYTRMAIEKVDQRRFFFDIMMKIFEIKPFYIEGYNDEYDVDVEDIIRVSNEIGNYDFRNCEFPGPMSNYETIVAKNNVISKEKKKTLKDKIEIINKELGVNLNICDNSEALVLDENQKAIKDFLEERGIKYLVHFTDKKNVPSILKHGILSKNKQKELGIWINGAFNSNENDSRCVSLSITNHNSKFEYAKKNRGEIGDVVYVYVRAEILYKDNTPRFYSPWNAAQYEKAYELRRFLNCIPSYRNNNDVNALKKMFDDDIMYSTFTGERYVSRQYRGYFDAETTDEQAEVVFIDKVDPKYIAFCWDANRGNFYGI